LHLDVFKHRVLAYVDGKKLPIPINLTTVNILLGKNFTESELKDYFESVRLKLSQINNSKDVIVSQVGELFYEKFFKNYICIIWVKKIHFSEINFLLFSGSML